MLEMHSSDDSKPYEDDDEVMEEASGQNRIHEKENQKLEK